MMNVMCKIDECANNPKNSSTTKFGENKHTLYSRKIFYEQVLRIFKRTRKKNIIDFEKKEMLLLTKEELKSHQDAKNCYICGKRKLKRAFYKYKLSES